MMSGHCLVSGAVIGVASAPGRDRTLATVQGDGVSCYAINVKVCIYKTRGCAHLLLGHHACGCKRY